MQPFSYQADCLEALDGARKRRRKKALVVMATGLGKTVVSAFEIQRLLKRRPGRVLYLCHQNDILRQARATFEEVLGSSYSYGYFHGTEKHLHRVDVLFASFQTMATSRELFDAREFDYVVVDEVHHAHAATFRPTVEYFQPRFMIGLTATPERGDGLDITELFGKPVYELGLFKALALGYLCEVDYRVMTDEIQNAGVLDTPVGKLSIAELNRTIFIPKRDEEIVRVIAEKIAEVQNPRVMIFCTSIEHAERMAELMPHAAVVHSKLKSDEKKRRLDAFRSGAIDTVLTVDMLNEGIDVPQANVIIFLRSTSSKTIFLQQLGRGLRKALGKLKVLVLDFVANCERIEMIDELVQATKKAASDLSSSPVLGDDELDSEGSEQRLPLTLTLDGVAFDERLVKLFEIISQVREGYTTEILTEQLRAKVEELGRNPTVTEVDSDGNMASTSVFVKTFQVRGWGDVLEAAGFAQSRYRQRLTKDDLAMQLRQLAERLGALPTTKDVTQDASTSALTVFYRVFETSWEDILDETGVREWYESHLLGVLRQKAEKQGGVLTSKDVSDDPSLPSPAYCTKLFNTTWNGLLEKLGISLAHKIGYTKEELGAALRAKVNSLGRIPTIGEVASDPDLPDPRTFKTCFKKNWRGVLAELELEK